MTTHELAAIRARDAAWKPDADLMDVFGACYGCEFDRRALLAMLDAVTRERDEARTMLRELRDAATPAFDTEDNRRALDAAIQRARKALGVK